MLVNMLKAIDKMLEGAKPEKVECAKEVLVELIDHLEKGESVTINNSPITVMKKDEIFTYLDPEAVAAKNELTGD